MVIFEFPILKLVNKSEHLQKYFLLILYLLFITVRSICVFTYRKRRFLKSYYK